MIVAMVAVRMMEMSVDQVVHVIAMRHRFVPASGLMHVGSVVTTATMLGCAPVRIGRREFDHMLVDVVAMDVVQVPIMQVVDVTVVTDGGVPTIGAMNMRMVVVLRSHSRPPAGCIILHGAISV
jgi:hypothetical protein